MKKIFLTIIYITFPLLCGAQALKGSYFLDNSLNRHELNPAFAPRADYVQLLGIGNAGMGMSGNTALSTFFYPKNGELLTFLHPEVSAGEFDKALPKNPGVSAEFSTTLLGFGFYTGKKSYWTFDLDLCVSEDATIPRELFMFLKKGPGVSGQSFNVGQFNADLYGGLQAAVGYSRDIFKGLRVGAKARLIAPFASVSINMDKMILSASPDKWSLDMGGNIRAALNNVDLTKPSDEIYLWDLLKGNPLSGFGYSFDLGAEYVLELGTLVDGLSVSAAITNLGQIIHKGSSVSTYKMTNYMEFTDVQDFEKILDTKPELSEMKNDGSLTRPTVPEVYLGVEMPFLKKMMSVGLLYSARLSRNYTYNELMLSYNLNPCKWFAFGVNYSFLSGADALGFLMEFTPRVGPAFYIGCDYFPTTYASLPISSEIKMLPLSMKLALNFGIALHIGGKNTRK